jgi:glucosylceramidase
LLFDVRNGIGFTWGRIPIGASDYAMARYTLNETANDLSMENFSIEHDKNPEYGLIPYIKAAQAVKPDLRCWASPWTPPTWMKSPSPAGGSGYDGGVMRNEPDMLRANALYQVRFVQAYEAEGIPIDHVQPQNEPGYTQHYPSCGWGMYRDLDNNPVNGQPYLGTFVADYLAPAFQQAGLSTKIWFGTLSNDATAAGYWNDARARAGQYITGVGLQWNNVNLVQTVASAGYLVMCSEHQCGNYPGSAPEPPAARTPTATTSCLTRRPTTTPTARRAGISSRPGSRRA